MQRNNWKSQSKILAEDVENSKSKDKELALKLLKEITGRKMDKDIV